MNLWTVFGIYRRFESCWFATGRSPSSPGFIYFNLIKLVFGRHAVVCWGQFFHRNKIILRWLRFPVLREWRWSRGSKVYGRASTAASLFGATGAVWLFRRISASVHLLRILFVIVLGIVFWHALIWMRNLLKVVEIIQISYKCILRIFVYPCSCQLVFPLLKLFWCPDLSTLRIGFVHVGILGI